MDHQRREQTAAERLRSALCDWSTVEVDATAHLGVEATAYVNVDENGGHLRCVRINKLILDREQVALMLAYGDDATGKDGVSWIEQEAVLQHRDAEYWAAAEMREAVR